MELMELMELMESVAELFLSSNQVRLRCAPPQLRFPRRALA